jgi:hypothetical protein
MNSVNSAWRQATTEHRRWLFWNAVVIAAVVNAVLNALIAWVTAANEDSVPLWAVPFAEGPSTVTDTVGTFFILPLLTTLVITTVAWHELRAGRLRSLQLDRESSPFLERLPKRRLRRGLYLGALCTLIFGPLAVVLLVALDYGDLSVGEFVLYKAIFGVVLGLVVTPIIALLAIGDDVDAEEVAGPGIEPGTP